MAIATKFVSKVADLTARPENLPSIRLLFGGRGVLSRWDVSMRRIGMWHLYHNLTPGGRLILPDRTVDMSPEKIYFIPGYTPIAVTVTELTVKKAPDKTVYTYKNDTSLDLAGLELEATYSDGSTAPIDPSACSITGYSAKPVGDKTVTVEYEGQTAQFKVTVKFAWWQQLIRIFLLGFIWY